MIIGSQTVLKTVVLNRIQGSSPWLSARLRVGVLLKLSDICPNALLSISY